MKIIYQKSEFLKNLFPEVNMNDNQAVETAIHKYLIGLGTTGIVKIEGDLISVELPDIFEPEFPKEFYQATNLCAQGKFVEARPIFEELIKKTPHVSEYYRNLAQTFEEDGQHEKAIDILIDALRWDPKNHWALILMGNIYARHKDDPDTAMTYYDQVVNADPGNFIALNNIGGAFLQNGKLDLGEKYMLKAYQINPKYPNTSYALGLIAEMKGDNLSAFKYAQEAIKNSDSSQSPIFQNSLKTALQASKKITDSDEGKEDLVDFINQLELKTDKEIRIEEDSTIPTAATVQIAENHQRDYYLIKFKPALAIDHIILHELVHIHFYHEAR